MLPDQHTREEGGVGLTDDRMGPPSPPPAQGRRFSLQHVLALALVITLAATAATMGVIRFVYQRQLARLHIQQELANNEHFGRFLEVLQLVHENYVEETDWDTLLKGATHGAVDALGDPYSFFYDVDEFEGLQMDIEGSYEGIGVVIMEKDRYTTVQAVMPGAPGAVTPFVGAGRGDLPGLMSGDRIVAVDAQKVVGLPMEQIAALIRGPSGTEVELTIMRLARDPAATIELRFVFTRARVDMPTVTYEMIDEQVAYLQIIQFTAHAPAAVADAVDVLQSQGMSALILDLRNNPGGTLQSCQELAGFFVPRGPVVHIVTGAGETQTLSTTRDPLGLPLVVLVNGGTASAAEILAAAVQDYGVGTLVGTNTFGKNSVQQIWRLDDHGPGRPSAFGPTGLKVTTARYLTAGNRSIEATGLEPEVIVDWPADGDELESAVDPQLQRGLEIIHDHLR